ncbi:penicillin-binding protein 2 [Candidatus Dependentiae bacterium]|nr:penicillin-binding protein 2 [Candidatus Dependentiae bacterium]
MKKRGELAPMARSIPAWLPALLLAAGFVWVGLNQVRLQVFGRTKILEAAKDAHRLFASEDLLARRGDIYSSDGRILARSTNSQRMGIDPEAVPTSPALWTSVARITGLSAAELMDFVSRRGRANDWDVVLSSQQAVQLNRVRAKYGADGLWVKPAGAREYSLGSYSAPLLGYVDDNEKGMAGLEKAQNGVLSGRSGHMTGIMDKSGSFLPWMTVGRDSRMATNGSNVVLTIDSDLQIAAMKSLDAQCQKHKASHGTAIVIEPKTGDILALASWPTYDPVRVAKAQQKMSQGQTVSPQFNPATGMRFEPGSTFKTFTVALGLDTGTISEATTTICTGAKKFFNRTMHCASGHVHGIVNPADCIEKSCNVAASTWAAEIGFKRFSQMIIDLGLLDLQNVGLSPETPGYLNFNDFNKTIQTANLGFGQSLNASPLGLASAFTAFANDGRRMFPRLIKSVDGEPWKIRPGKQIFKPAIARRVLEMMQQVIQGDAGTGTALRVPGYTLAGKTGTAQKLGSSRGRNYVSSFIGYVPAIDPKAVVLVMIDEPKAGGHYGGVVAGPAFKDLARFILKKDRIPPDAPEAIVAVH